MQAHTLNHIWGPRKIHFVGRGGRTGCPNDHSVVSQCNLVLPTSWQELTATQLRYVFFLLSQNYSAEEVKTFCLCRFGGLKVLERTATGFRVLYDNQFLLIYQGTTKELPTKKLSNVSSIQALAINVLIYGRYSTDNQVKEKHEEYVDEPGG